MSETEELIARLESFPVKLREAVQHLTEEQLQTKITNWTIKQAIHHIADSHINSYIRIKLALTESTPTIMPYNESAWSTLADITAPIDFSLDILNGIHLRICIVLKSLSSSDWEKKFIHPELNPSEISLVHYVNNFVNHGEHHLNSIIKTLNRF